MTTTREYLDYRSYSEIDYLLNSDLAETSYGVFRLMDRLTLFDLSKQHIPYLLLIHKVFYSQNFESKAKRNVISKLLEQLYSHVLRRKNRNQLCDFFPHYYVSRLLFDLYLAGYNVTKLLKGLEIADSHLISYSDFSIETLPISLWKFLNISRQAKGSKLTFELADASLKAMNLTGFYDLVKVLKDKNLKTHLLIIATKIHIYRNEISEALKLADSVNNEIYKSSFYLQIGLSLSEIKKISILRELKHSIVKPELLIGIIFGLLDYHAKRNEESFVKSLLDEAEELLRNIGDNILNIYRTAWLIKFLYENNKTLMFNKYLELYYIYESFLNKDETENVKTYLYHKLISIGQTDLVRSDAQKWFIKGDPKDATWQVHNMDVFFQGMVENDLDSIDLKVYEQRTITKNVNSIDPMNLYQTALRITEIIHNEYNRDFALEQVAKHMALHGYYEVALNVRTRIKEVEYHNSVDFSLPMAAITNGDIDDSMHYAEIIPEEKHRLAVQLCMTPHLENMNQTGVASKFLKEWATYIFQYC